MEINHFSHEHPLVLSEEKTNDAFPCSICSHSIFGLSYCCLECRYVVHYWCAELPRNLSCPKLHEKHDLTLHSPPPTGPPVSCDACFFKIDGFVYSCTTPSKEDSVECSFNLHVYCAFYPKPIIFDIPHDKPELTLDVPNYQEESQPCYVCAHDIKGPVLKEEDDGFNKFIQCHFQCVNFPRIIKHEVHLHDLFLRPPPLGEKEKYLEFFCNACEEERDPDACVYSCESCELYTHIGCGISGSKYRTIQNVLETYPVYELSEVEKAKENKKKDKNWGPERYSFGYFDKPEIGGADLPAEHSSQLHPLSVFNFPKAVGKSCFRCGLSIFGITYCCTFKIWTSCYTFQECSFVIHRRCAKLPKEIRQWMHPDHGALKLLPEDDCHIREERSTSYGCEKCEYKLDLNHALLPNNLNHPSHEHALTAVNLSPYEPYSYEDDGQIDPDDHQIELKILSKDRIGLCQACGFLCTGLSLMCDPCHFYLHVSCFILPLTGKHTTHRHDLKLTYSYKEDPIALEFYCDTCETPRIPNRWVYVCPDPNCIIVSHIECVFPDIASAYEHEHQR